MVKGLQHTHDICVPRYYLRDSTHTYTLYGFCDAAMVAYAALIYIVPCSTARVQTKGHTAYIEDRRVAPLQSQTIPRLELLAAVLLARLVTTVQEALSKAITLEESLCYTDSKIVLHWIKGQDKSWKLFVQNRVQEIRSQVNADCWGHCPENPTDIPSQGSTAQELEGNTL